MENYNYEVLSTIQGETVTIKDSSGNTADLTISEINQSRMNGPDWEAFSVIYTGKEDLRIPEGTYLFHHPSFGELELFLSPKSPTQYETMVTRKRAS